MALRKEPYGLVYNTDGTLCTTYRDDDVPFRGVRSFAVETATTNLFDSFSIIAEGSNVQNPADDPTGKFSSVIRINPNSVPTYYGKDITTVVDSPYSGQVWCYVSNDFDGTGLVGLYCERGLDNLKAYYNKSKKGTWQLLKKENILATSTSGRLLLYVFSSFTTGFVLFARQQVEQKPFASSFVEGSRPSGSFVISVEDLKFDIANDDWVISYWKYPVATSDDTQNGSNLCSLGQYTSDRSKGYIWWGETDNRDIICFLDVVLNDATSIENISDNTFNPTDYFYHWHYEVLKKQGKVLSYYVDGVKQCELIIPADKELQAPFDVGLSLGGFTGDNVFYPTNALFAAPYYGYNSATWTDEYIREVYEAKIPYPAQNKLSIY